MSTLDKDGKNMLKKALDFIEYNKLIKKGDRIVVGVSGGADSVCLLHVLRSYQSKEEITLYVVHVNHMMRGIEADRDEQFVRELCKNYGLTYQCFSYEVRKIAAEESLSEEEAGRKIRYESFLNVCKKYKCNKIAIAHNKNDNAETVLFHLIRGSGIRGLSGIDITRTVTTLNNQEVEIIRPLLSLKRSEIEEYLSKMNFDYIVDSSNLTDDYSRNKIRNQVLSYITKEINTKAVEHITKAAEQIGEVSDFIDQLIDNKYKRIAKEDRDEICLSLEELQKEDIVIQKGIIRKAIEKLSKCLKDIEYKHIEKILELKEKPVGKTVHLPNGLGSKKAYDSILIYKNNNTEEEKETKKHEINSAVLPIPGDYELKNYGKRIKTKLIVYDKNARIPNNSCNKWIDYDKIKNTVVIRNRTEGDYLQINKNGGNKKLKDYFIDKKIPREMRDNILLIADGNHIIWILGDGERISEYYKVNENTKRILWMNLKNMEEEE